MREVVIERYGVLHYAIRGWNGGRERSLYKCWYIFCDPSVGRRIEYRDHDVQEDFPTCVRCLGEEMLRGKDLEPIELE